MRMALDSRRKGETEASQPAVPYDLQRMSRYFEWCDVLRSKVVPEAATAFRFASIRSLKLPPSTGVMELMAVAEMLRYDNVIHTLDCSGCALGDHGAQIIAEMLLGTTRLRELKLSDCGIGSAGATVLLKAVQLNGCLQRLVLRGNPIGLPGAVALGKVLRRTKTLSYVDVSACKLQRAGVSEITHSLIQRAQRRLEKQRRLATGVGEGASSVSHAGAGGGGGGGGRERGGSVDRRAEGGGEQGDHHAHAGGGGILGSIDLSSWDWGEKGEGGGAGSATAGLSSGRVTLWGILFGDVSELIVTTDATVRTVWSAGPSGDGGGGGAGSAGAPSATTGAGAAATTAAGGAAGVGGVGVATGTASSAAASSSAAGVGSSPSRGGGVGGSSSGDASHLVPGTGTGVGVGVGLLGSGEGGSGSSGSGGRHANGLVQGQAGDTAGGGGGDTLDIEVRIAGNFVLEETVNAVLHGVGLLCAACGTLPLLRQASSGGGAGQGAVGGEQRWHLLGVSAYTLSLLAFFTTSTLNHTLSTLLGGGDRGPAALFRALDHSAAFALIAGTYTPFLLVNLSFGPLGVGLLVLVWSLACVGILLSTACAPRPLSSSSASSSPSSQAGKLLQRLRLLLYGCMGWLALIPHGLVRSCVSSEGWTLLAVGGCMFTLGLALYSRERRPTATIWSWWYLLVLLASACHYFAVLWHVQPPSAQCLSDAQSYGLVPSPLPVPVAVPVAGPGASAPLPLPGSGSGPLAGVEAALGSLVGAAVLASANSGGVGHSFSSPLSSSPGGGGAGHEGQGGQEGQGQGHPWQVEVAQNVAALGHAGHSLGSALSEALAAVHRAAVLASGGTPHGEQQQGGGGGGGGGGVLAQGQSYMREVLKKGLREALDTLEEKRREEEGPQQGQEL